MARVSYMPPALFDFVVEARIYIQILTVRYTRQIISTLLFEHQDIYLYIYIYSKLYYIGTYVHRARCVIYVYHQNPM